MTAANGAPGLEETEPDVQIQSAPPGQKRGSGPCIIKFLTPEALAAAIIGKGGAVIGAMRQSSQSKIALTEHGDYYPGSECRVLTIQAPTEEALTAVCNQVIAKTCETHDALAEGLASGESRLKALIPRAAVGALIGKGGAAVKQLRERSRAKISIDEPSGSSPSADQIVTVSGTAESLQYVMTAVIRQTQALSSEPWFQTWGLTTSTARSGGGSASWSTGAGSMGYAEMPLAAPLYAHHAPQGVDLMLRVAQSLPAYVMEDSRGFAMSCVVPNRLVGGLIGRGGQGTKEVQSITGTKIGFREIPGDPDNRSMNIAGPLASTCAAYMLMMRRYLDTEAQGASSSGAGAGRR